MRVHIFSKKQKRLHSFRSNLGLGMVMFLIFLFGITILIYTDSYETTLLEQRKQSYGSWNAAFYNASENLHQQLAGHATMESVGTMHLYASVTDDFGNTISNLGFLDDNLLKIGNIQLLDGHFPNTTDEIAIEAFSLTQLGYSYELNQPIELTITYIDENKALHELQKTFTLCGVVKNYSANWKSNSNDLVSFFTTSAYCEEQLSSAHAILHIFTKLCDKYIDTVDNLNVFCPNPQDFVKNEFTYTQYSDSSATIQDYYFLLALLLLAGCLAIFILINNNIVYKRDTFVTMRLIGAKRIQILNLYLKEKLPTIFVSVTAGLFCGFSLPYFFILFLNKMSEQTIYFHIQWTSLLQMLLFFGIGTILTFLLGMIRLFQIPLRGKPQQQSALKKVPKHRRKLNPNNLFSVFNSIDRYKRLFSILLTAVTSSLLLFSAYQAWETFLSYRFYCEKYPEDYSFGMISYYETNNKLDPETLIQIESAYGVKEIQTIASSDYYDLTFSKEPDFRYAQLVDQYMQAIIEPLDSLHTFIYGSFLGISDNLYSAYANEVDTELQSTDFLEKYSVILYLPDFYLSENNEIISADFATTTQKSNTIIRETSIHPGDTIQVQISGKEYELTIEGIIYNFEDSMPEAQKTPRPYTMICTQETYLEIFDTYQASYTAVYHDSSTIAYQTDIELSKINTSSYFNNQRAEREEQKNQLFSQIILTVVLFLFGLIISLMIRFGIHITTAMQDTERYHTLYQLGVKRSSILKHFLRNATYDSFMGTAIGMLLLCLNRYTTEKTILLSAEGSVFTTTYDLIADILQRIYHYTDWSFLFLLFIVIVILNCIIIFSYDSYLIQNKFFQQNQ